MKILIGSAWPYANGSLHIGHIAALLPADILARYHRAKGDEVYLVSGSDCHGTPVVIRARATGQTPQEVSDAYHAEFCDCFDKLGFSFDRYGQTSAPEHQRFVQAFHAALYQSPYVYEQESAQAYCEHCSSFLPDRFVEGQCPACGAPARGDQCEACGTVLEPEGLHYPRCALCGQTPVFQNSSHLYIALSRLQPQLEAYLAAHPAWRKNARSFSARYLQEGLRDRALTRDLSWGVDVPQAGYEQKKIYIWAENVLGYLSMSQAVAEERGQDFAALWDAQAEGVRHYYVHGKDNIPFHTIILPALLLAQGGNWRLPDSIISSEYLTLEGRKISTSQNWAIWAKDLLTRYHPDSIRYFLTTNGPEKRDADFSWREFIHSHNSELLGAYGNLIHRTLSFLHKYLGGCLPEGPLDPTVEAQWQRLFPATGAAIEQGRFKEALDGVFEAVRFGNRYFDAQKPWETRESYPAACRAALLNVVQLIANLALLLEPFLPFSTAQVRQWLALPDNTWQPVTVAAGQPIPEPQVLFQRIEKERLAEELARLQSPAGA